MLRSSIRSFVTVFALLLLTLLFAPKLDMAIPEIMALGVSNNTSTHATIVDAPPVNKPLMKIVGFMDIGYLPVATKWYKRLLHIGYTADEIELVCHDEESYKALVAANATITIKKKIIKNPD